MATKSIGSYKGVPIRPGTQEEVNAQIAAINASAPTLSGTGTPPPNPRPVVTPTTTQGGGAAAPTLPSGGGGSALLSFADSLDAAVNLARKSRNASSLEMMKPFQGTVAASDFNSILGGLNAASDKTSENLIKRVTEASEGIDSSDVYTTVNDNGDVSAFHKVTGEPLWSQKGVGNRQTGGGGGDDGSGVGVTYTPGASPVVDSWVSLVQEGEYTLEDVPAKLKNAVAIALTSPATKASALRNLIVGAQNDKSTYEQVVATLNANPAIIDKAGAIAVAREVYGVQDIPPSKIEQEIASKKKSGILTESDIRATLRGRYTTKEINNSSVGTVIDNIGSFLFGGK